MLEKLILGNMGKTGSANGSCSGHVNCCLDNRLPCSIPGVFL